LLPALRRTIDVGVRVNTMPVSVADCDFAARNAVLRGARPFRASDRRADKDSGFTLLELLVVLAILGLLVGLVAPAALRQLGSAKEKIAHQSIERLGTVLDMYKLDVGSYPTTEQGLASLVARPPGLARWNGPYLKGDKLPEDPWGHPYVYRSPSQRPAHDYDLYSLGPSGQQGGTGDAAPIYND
jgi:general secretion pathway protein G